METIPGSGNWKLTIRREAAGITILRAATCDARARLPETLYGLPVTALGDHALSPPAASAEGEDLLVTCGAGTDPGTWSNRDLEDLTLPRSLERVGDYALMNCGGLRTLRLHDGIGQWGGGGLMNCRRLASDPGGGAGGHPGLVCRRTALGAGRHRGGDGRHRVPFALSGVPGGL